MKIPVGKFAKQGKAFLVKHAADILTGFTTFGVVLTAFETHKATLKAEEYLRVNGYEQANPDTQKVLKWESRKNYILPAALGAATIGSAVGANAINHKQIAALAAACTVAETALSEHRDKIEELMGEKALTKIDDEINIDKAQKILKNDDEILDTGHGRTLVVDTYFTGRKIWASPEYVKRAINEYNELVNNETYCSSYQFAEILLRDVLRHAIIPERNFDDGYNIHVNGLLRMKFTSDIDEATGQPYLAITPINKPIANYMEIF